MMICPRCTEEIKQGAQFCVKCGMRVMQEQITMQPQSQMGQPIMQPQPQQMRQPTMQPQAQPRMPYPTMQPNYYQQAPQYMQNQNQNTKSKKLPIIVLSILAVIFVVIAVALVLKIVSDNEADKKSMISARPEQGSVSAGADNKPDDKEDSNPSMDTDEEKPEVIPDESVKAEHTIMVYMIGSDLESDGGAASADIEEMLSAEYDESIRVVIQTGGCSQWVREEIADGEVQRFEIKGGQMIEIASLGTINMVDPGTLADFISFTSDTFPAEKYTLVLWDHGGGIPIGFGQDENYPYDIMYDAEIGTALETAGVFFESIIFDACNMCTLEVAMAVKDYAKYMVAAESYTWSIGMFYDNWLNYIGEDSDATALESCELLVTDYMEALEVIDTVGSMSLITLSKIQNVYDAYVDYLESIHEDIINGNYVEYTQVRSSCGLYEGTDSVDLITLATSYNTGMSSLLMNAVVNAVYYTDSDFLYGHGLAAYCPFNYVEYYDVARSMLVRLGYETRVIEFFDSFVSVKLAYLGNDYIDAYSGNWFDSELAYSYVEEDSEVGDYYLETTLKDDHYAICLSEDDWEIVSTIEVGVIVMLDDVQGMMLGQDYFYNYDVDGDIAIELPDYWVRVNGNIASYICTDIYEDIDTGEWSQSGLIYARCNGNPVMLIVYYDEEYPQGTIVGYMPYDFETSKTGTVRQLDPDDVVELITPIVSGDTGEIMYDNVLGESFLASELELSYQSIYYDGYEVVTYYVVYDIYGNSYTTDDFYF